VTRAITWHPGAESELAADVDWYDERELGLGDRFEGQVLGAVNESADTPAAWPVWPGWDTHDPGVDNMDGGESRDGPASRRVRLWLGRSMVVASRSVGVRSRGLLVRPMATVSATKS